VFFGSARNMSPSKMNRYLKTIDTSQLSITEKKRLENKKLMTQYYRDATKLAYRLTKWAKGLHGEKKYMIGSGGGPGIMEATNRGAYLAKGESVGLNIDLPFEQEPNKYITRKYSFDFNYFFMRKLWFMSLSVAMVIFPGGFGTCDEFFELLTLIQTGKKSSDMPIILFGKKYWKELINFQTFVDWGTISEKDLKLFKIVDSVDEAFQFLTERLDFLYDKSNPGHLLDSKDNLH